MSALEKEGLDLENNKDVDDFTSYYFDNPDDIACFKTRLKIQRSYGANKDYTGNGTTKNLNPSTGECGVMEVLNVDKNPELVGTLIRNNAAVRLSCKCI